MPVGVSKLKMTEGKKNLSFFMAQKKCGARILHHNQFPKSLQSGHSHKQQGSRKKCRIGDREGREKAGLWFSPSECTWML